MGDSERKVKRLRCIVDNHSEAKENQLFKGSDNEDDNRRRKPIREEAVEYTEADDFIVDADGRPLKDGRRKRKATFTDAALQTAWDMFAVDWDYDAFENDEEGRTDHCDNWSRPRCKTKSIYDIYEPHELERAGLTEEDRAIRRLDIPERMQLRSVPITPADDEELDEEAEWIYQTGFINERIDAARYETVRKMSASVSLTDEWEANWDDDWDKRTVISVGSGSLSVDNWNFLENCEDVYSWDEENWERPPKNTGADSPEMRTPQDKIKPTIISKIRKALEFMRNMLFEVPFIAFYRKEYVLPDLDINDLWKIYRLDARFCSLKKRKSRLVKLFNNLREHQTDVIRAHPDNPISDCIRLITDDDIEMIKVVQNGYELNDVYLLFTLYYGNQVPAMKHNLTKRRMEEQQRARNAEAAAECEDEEEEDTSFTEVEVDDDFELPTTCERSCRCTFPKRKMGSGPYIMCKKLGVGVFMNKFGLSAGKFGENLRGSYKLHKVEQCSMDPLKAAKEICSANPEDVLKAAKLMMATEISREPIVRGCVRKVFFERATISCFPTKKGINEIDEAHECFTFKYLRDKPVRDFTGDQYLKLMLAEEDRLLTIQLGEIIKGATPSTSYIEEVKLLFSSKESSKNVQTWNTLRGECIEDAFQKFLYPDLRKELRAKLAEDAKEHVFKACREKLRNWLKVPPSKIIFSDDYVDYEEGWDTSRGIRVLALAYDPDPQMASFACLVSPDGEPSDFLRLQNITKKKHASLKSDRDEKAADIAAIKNFIRDKKPHLIVIGGESLEARMIQHDIKGVVVKLMSQDDFPDIKVEIVDNELAKVYAKSTRAINDFRDYPLLLREAVSLGRRMQDPLIEYSQLCTADEELLCVRFHPLQDHVPKEKLLEHLYQEFINQTNQVGVDINRAIAHPYTDNLIQFTGGLGPRKAAALIKNLKQNNQRLENRSQLVTEACIGPIILVNCGGFIKIDTNALGDSTETYIEILDGSRVHPESNEWARKMAVDSFDYDIEEDFNPAKAVEKILDSPRKLLDLDLDAFALELKRLGLGKKINTLYDIRSELCCPYKDPRNLPESLTQEDLFYMLTKETKETLYVGKLITGVVVGLTREKPNNEELDNAIPVKNEITGMWQCALCGQNDFPDLSEVWAHFDVGSCPGQATGVRIRLDNGITGCIPFQRIPDKQLKQVTNPDGRVNGGQPIHCRVVKIDMDHFSVECTSTSSDMMDIMGDWRPKKDPYYDRGREDLDMKKDELSRKFLQRPPYIKRIIFHPSFKNVTFLEAEALMLTMDQGEVIVRPSSKGANHLTVTWKVADGVSQHVDILEHGKVNAFSLGKSLWIDNEEFEDLDEIIVRYINPMASYARELINYKYYNSTLGGCRHRADNYLLWEKAKNPNKIHYILQASKEFPGKFLLSYLPRAAVAHEFVTVTPHGFRFRQLYFENLEELLMWFKEHYRGLPPEYMFAGKPWKTHGNGTPDSPTYAMSHLDSHPASPATPNCKKPAEALAP